MKKITSLILALVMALSLTVTALAAPTTVIIKEASGTSGEIKVPATGHVTAFDASKVTDTYYVVMRWEVKSTLTYTLGETDYKWNVYNAAGDKLTNSTTTPTDTTPSTAKYVAEGVWSGNATVTVGVANWSNVPITATPTWADGVKDANGVTKDIQVAAMKNLPAVDIEAASKGKGVDEVVAAADVTETSVVNVKIDADNDSTAITGAIGNGDATIGTLTVTIAKKGA